MLAGFIAEKDVCHILVIFHSLMLFRVVVLPPGSRCLAYEAMSSGEAPRRFKEVNRKIQGVSVEIYNLNLAVWSILLSVLVFARNRLGDPRIISLFYAYIGRNLLETRFPIGSNIASRNPFNPLLWNAIRIAKHRVPVGMQNGREKTC